MICILFNWKRLGRGDYTASRPGSVTLAAIDVEAWPVMNDASSDAMKTMAFATSSERPRRCIGTVVTKAALFSGVPVKRVNMPVSMGPRRHDVRADPRFDGLQRHRLGDAFDSVLAADVAGNLRCLVKVYRAVERYWHRMLRSRSWAGRALNWSMFNQLKERTPLLRPKLRLPYAELQPLAVL